MRKFQCFTFLFAATSLISSVSIGNAQNLTCPRSDYTVGPDGCLHRFPWAVLKGCREQRQECPGPGHTPSQPPVYTLTTPIQVANAIVCDIAAAGKATKGTSVDFSKATIRGEITFSEVTKTSAGASLKVAAIPVFSGASATPSLDASRISSETLQGVTSFKVDPSQLTPCTSSSRNQWLTSQAVTGSLPPAFEVTKFTVAVQFVLTKQASAGLNLNIIPVSIGPQFSSGNDKTQKLCLLFNFDKDPEKADLKPSCQSGQGAGQAQAQ